MMKQRKSVSSPPAEEERVAETMCDELTTTPITCPPSVLGGRGSKFRSKL